MQILKLETAITLRLDTAAAQRLKALDLLDVFEVPGNPQAFAKILSEPVSFAQTLWELSDKAESTFETFCRLIQEVDHEELWQAFFEELTDFFRDPTIREIVEITIEAAVTGWRQTLQNQLERVKLMLSEQSLSEDGERFGSLPESSESILAHSHCANSTTWQQDGSEAVGVAVVA